MMKTAIAAALLALSAGAALAGDVTPYDKELASPKAKVAPAPQTPQAPAPCACQH